MKKKNAVKITGLLVWLFLMLGGCFAVKNKETKKETVEKKETLPVSAAGIPASAQVSPLEEKEVLKGKDGVFAVLQTVRGDIVIELFYKQTPLTVVNFVGLAEGTLDAAKGKPFYDGLKFHRVISKANGDADNFMIQGGDPRGTGSGGPGYRFPDEFVSDLRHDKSGRLSMANSGPKTNGSQFFITIVPTPWLDDRHTIFGQVIDGLSVVETVKQNDLIQKVTIIRQGKDAGEFKATQKEWDAALIEYTERQRGSAEAAAKFLPKGIKTPEGILYTITKEGSGNKTETGKNVQVHYNGYFLNGEKFDSSYDRGSPLPFKTGAGQMIPGFDKMVQDMRLGEKRTIVLPPNEAYGARGVENAIPPNGFICFDIELISIS
jgi:cyclophilin family peptidyl-prolyl cis-trans isomerase